MRVLNLEIGGDVVDGQVLVLVLGGGAGGGPDKLASLSQLRLGEQRCSEWEVCRG